MQDIYLRNTENQYLPQHHGYRRKLIYQDQVIEEEKSKKGKENYKWPNGVVEAQEYCASFIYCPFFFCLKQTYLNRKQNN